MKKGLIIKLAIVLVVLVLSYCVFWFYKAGQSEKQINKFIADNSANISAGEISVTGFPVGQKIIVSDLKITVPVNLVAKRQIIIKKLVFVLLIIHIIHPVKHHYAFIFH